MNIVKTMALISCKVTMQLICNFVFAYTKTRFSDDAAQICINGCDMSHQSSFNWCLGNFNWCQDTT